MNETENRKYEDEPKLPSAVAAGAGAIAGGVGTSGAALTAAGGAAAGVSGYVAGVGVLAAHAGCEALALVGLGTVFAGPIIGGALGYGLYRGVKRVVRG